MADAQLKQKVRDVLRGAYFKDPDDLVDVSDGPGDSVHVTGCVEVLIDGGLEIGGSHPLRLPPKLNAPLSLRAIAAGTPDELKTAADLIRAEGLGG